MLKQDFRESDLEVDCMSSLGWSIAQSATVGSVPISATGDMLLEFPLMSSSTEIAQIDSPLGSRHALARFISNSNSRAVSGVCIEDNGYIEGGGPGGVDVANGGSSTGSAAVVIFPPQLRCEFKVKVISVCRTATDMKTNKERFSFGASKLQDWLIKEPADRYFGNGTNSFGFQDQRTIKGRSGTYFRYHGRVKLPKRNLEPGDVLQISYDPMEEGFTTSGNFLPQHDGYLDIAPMLASESSACDCIVMGVTLPAHKHCEVQGCKVSFFVPSHHCWRN